jgi:hypothetical protein
MTYFKQAIRDGVADLLADVASGAISAKDAERELDVCKALCELIAMAAEMGPWAVPAEERMRRDQNWWRYGRKHVGGRA